MKGEASSFFFNWRPALRDSKTDVSSSYTLAVARTIDAIHNSGWLAGCIEQSKGNIVGGLGLRLAFKPEPTAIAWDAKELNDWARMVERRFEIWAKDKEECDAAGKHTLAQLQEQAVDTYYSHGEVLGLLPRLDRPNAITGLKVALLPPHKLVQDTMESIGMHQGVTMGAWSYPLKYRICMPTSFGTDSDLDIPAYTPSNQQQVLHVFKGTPGQVRGMTPFVHALKIIKQYDQLSDATLTKAMIDAIFAATLQSAAPTADVLRALQDDDEQGINTDGSIVDLLSAKAGFYQNTNIDLGRAGKIAHLFPGEELKLTTSTRISGDYEAFAKFLLREIARCLGLSFEAVTGDYSGATYSSVRMSSSELWPLTVSRRTHIVARFLQEVFMQWLDEEIVSGRIPFKGGVFAYMAVRKAMSTEWRGPPKPQADDLKSAKAMEVLKALGIASDEQLCAELGTDYEDVYEQRAREKQMREELDLPEHKTMDPDPEVEAMLKEPENA
jgi:lambda family phage portal protein